MNRLGLFLVVPTMVTALASCEVRQFPVFDDPNVAGAGGNGAGGSFPGTGGVTDAGTGGSAGSAGQGGGVAGQGGGVAGMRGDACAPMKELCNGADDDCDGKVDNGFDLTSDPGNCGQCGKVCTFEHAFPVCNAGVCGVKECLPGYFDADAKPENGCECLRSNAGIELCDGADNDCDGKVDEDFDFQKDLANCGACGKSCDFANAAALCEAGMCKMGACAAGRIDLNKDAEDGCEYSCTVTNNGVEICDSMDNDCDGGIDNAPVDAGMECGPMVVGSGECKRGKITCTTGKLVCLGAIEPQTEICDGRDNNCDGTTDEGFDKLNDIRYCGTCKPCALARAVPRCDQGACRVEVCSPGWVNLNQMDADGCEYSCTFRGLDVCNGQDDDCDGMTDEGIDKMTDPNNCGACGVVCRYGNARGVCSNGACMRGACDPNFFDADGKADNGCEYFCVATGNEVCDGIDNDCDAQVDEGIDKTSDPNNCGVCGRVCQFSHAGATCSAGQCVIGACEAGFTNPNGQPTDGCEYACTPTNGGTEICDGKDNDCDTQFDESDAQIGQRCYPSGAGGCDVNAGTCAGQCAFGSYSCLGGSLACQGSTLPSPETCDNKDNDCDGSADEDFDKQNDPRFCGGCGITCSFANAVAVCTNGGCAIGACKTGYVNLDGQQGNGCEYGCTIDGPEVCDGKDNDCDGKTDAVDDDLLYPTTNFCLQFGECGKGPGGSTRYPGQASFPVCTTPVGATTPDWVCNYPATVQTTSPNQIVGQESWCDGLDNDCDGASDEHVSGLNASCTGTGVGACPWRGTIRCQADKTLAPACDFTGSPAPVASDETCDGQDNDCDGLTDEAWDNPGGLGLPTCAGGAACKGVRDAVAYASAATAPFYIYQHEASRPDATPASQGASSARACSRAGVKPWTSLNYAQAQAACAAAGMRLCKTNRTNCTTTTLTTDEWGYACQIGLSCTNGSFPYGCTYQTQSCNGKDRNAGTTVATGSLATCTTGDLDAAAGTQAAFDLSGNVAEWTQDCRGTLSDGTSRKIYTLRGGAYDSEVYGTSTSLRCDFMAVQVAETYAHPTAGFRCCSICAPGLAECSGSCVDLGTNASHCGGCGVACAGGQVCRNGSCQ